MPLRAKILHRAFTTGSSDMPDQSTIPRPLPNDPPDDVLFHSTYGVRTIELNRPQKLNSLNASMARKIIPRLLEWQKSDLLSAVIIAGAGDKAFCAGGDVAALAQANRAGPEGAQEAADFFNLEYRLNHLIATYRKPYVAYMDGITMGGGVGLSLHAPFRIATERTVFAMPETTIGFFPDVGGSFFLPRMDGNTGKYLALTSERLTGVNAFYAGVATHYVHSFTLRELTARLSELVFDDHESLAKRVDIINTTIEEYNTGLPADQPMLLAGDMRRAIDYCFDPDELSGIIGRLERLASEPSVVSAWAQQTLDTLSQRSPTSLKVTIRQLRLGRRWNIAETFQREYQMARVFIKKHDFTEGVLARLVEKRKPQWQPSHPEAVSEDAVEEYFDDATSKLKLLTDGNYTSYRHAWLGLPREVHIEAAVNTEKFKSPEAAVEYFVDRRMGQTGVREKVTEVMQRMTVMEGNLLKWQPR